MRALGRSHTSSPSSSANSSALSVPSSSWIHLRSVFLVVASSSPAYCSSSDRGNPNSPWSRRKRKNILSPQQWRSLFTSDGKLHDGGAKFLKNVRSGGVDPSIRAEIWPFLLGVYCYYLMRLLVHWMLNPKDALDRVMVNRTTVVVAHRLSTIKNADVILVV